MAIDKDTYDELIKRFKEYNTQITLDDIIDELNAFVETDKRVTVFLKSGTVIKTDHMASSWKLAWVTIDKKYRIHRSDIDKIKIRCKHEEG